MICSSANSNLGQLQPRLEFELLSCPSLPPRLHCRCQVGSSPSAEHTDSTCHEKSTHIQDVHTCHLHVLLIAPVDPSSRALSLHSPDGCSTPIISSRGRLTRDSEVARHLTWIIHVPSDNLLFLCASPAGICFLLPHRPCCECNLNHGFSLLGLASYGLVLFSRARTVFSVLTLGIRATAFASAFIESNNERRMLAEGRES